MSLMVSPILSFESLSTSAPFVEMMSEEHSYFISRFFVREGFYDESTGQEQVLSDRMSDKMSDKERQRIEIILNYLKENTSITSSKAAELIGKEIKTANRLLVKAVNLGLFKSEGEYKNRIYLLK